MQDGKMNITKKEFGKTPDGQISLLYTLINSQGHSVSISPYGGIVTSIIVPDKIGKLGDVVLGYDHLDGYLTENPYFGCIIGRYANRISRGKFGLGGHRYILSTNSGPNHLHGGARGFDKKVWQAKEIRGANHVGLELTSISLDGDEGYPGTLEVAVCYRWTERDDLEIDSRAQTDAPTLCNLSHHSYFNLKDAGASPILDHQLKINSDLITPVDRTLIPTGDFLPVVNTPFDFRQFTPIGKRIDNNDPQLDFGLGYDHNFVLKGRVGKIRLAATLYDHVSGRILEIFSTEPGLQFYSGNFLDGRIHGKDGVAYKHRHGLCLETQHYPDSPNHADFPSTVLRPGQVYSTKTTYSFRTKK
jgi:aldose 1-epimerase